MGARYNATVRLPVLITSLFALSALSAFGFAGCRPRPTSGAGRFAQPPSGVARLLFTRLGPDHVKWSLIGERNWTSASVDGLTATLGGVYPLNAADRQGGTNVWEIDLATTPQGSYTGWKLKVHGSNGASAESSGRASGSLSLALDTDADLLLPAQQPLARIGDATLKIAVAR